MTDRKNQIISLLVFAALTCLYFYDVLLRGAMLTAEDGFTYYYPMMITMAKQYKDLIFPFWNPYQYSGFPLLGAMEPGALYPFKIILPLILSPSWAFNLHMMIHFALAGFFTFLYARQIGLSTFSALVSGSVFSFLGYFPAHLNHESVLAAGVWIPLILFFIERLKRDLRLKDALSASLVIALQVFAGHPQISFYTHLLLALYIAFSLLTIESIKRVRFALMSLLAIFTGMLLALPQLVPAYELAKLGTRTSTSYEFFSSYPFPVHMLPTFLFPFLYYSGGSFNGTLWGPIPNLGEEAFVGTLPFLLAMVVLTRWRKNPQILFWGIAGGLALTLALGDAISPLNRMLYHVPLYNFFRGPSKHMLQVSLSLSILAGFGISLLQSGEKERRFVLHVAAVLFTVIAVCTVAFTFFDDTLRAFFSDAFSRMRHFQLRWPHAAVPSDALRITDVSVFRPLMAMAVYLVCVIACLRSQKKAVRTLILSVIFVTLCYEAYSWKIKDNPLRKDVANFHKDLYETLAPRTDGKALFLTRRLPPVTAMPYGIHVSDGYESLETTDFKKMLPRMNEQTPETWLILLKNNSLLSMMNVRYLVVDRVRGEVGEITWGMIRDEDGKISPLPPAVTRPEGAVTVPVYRKLADFPSLSLYENTFSLPRAYSVKGVIAVEGVDDLMRRLFSFRMNPWQQAALSAGDIQEIGADSFPSGDVRVKEERPDKVTLATAFKGKGFVVLADHFYPGWRAYIDGTRTTIYRTNGVLRGVVVPGGAHTIVFKYVPLHIYASMTLSGIILFMIFVVLLKGHRKKRRGVPAGV